MNTNICLRDRCAKWNFKKCVWGGMGMNIKFSWKSTLISITILSVSLISFKFGLHFDKTEIHTTVNLSGNSTMNINGKEITDLSLSLSDIQISSNGNLSANAKISGKETTTNDTVTFASPATIEPARWGVAKWGEAKWK